MSLCGAETAGGAGQQTKQSLTKHRIQAKEESTKQYTEANATIEQSEVKNENKKNMNTHVSCLFSLIVLKNSFEANYKQTKRRCGDGGEPAFCLNEPAVIQSSLNVFSYSSKPTFIFRLLLLSK